MTERRFARNLRVGGSAAAIRECVKQDLKERSVLTNKAKLVEPLDYENVIVKNKTILHNDPLRELLLFPHDDVSQSELARRLRTFQSSVPPSALSEVRQLLARECIKSYIDKWHVIHFKYSAYSGGFQQLPKIIRATDLPKQVFEIDVEAVGKDEDRAHQSKHTQIKKKGWLLKGPDSNHEASIVSFTKSFKRRYCYLKQEADANYKLEFHKDDRREDSKGSIFLDSAVDVLKNVRKGKLSFEIQMQDKGFYLLCAESEAELEEWVALLKKIIQSNDVCQPSVDRFKDKELELPRGESLRDSLEYSMNPELQKYARETDISLAAQRKEGRGRLFSFYNEIQKQLLPESQTSDETSEAADVYKEQFGCMRFFVHCTEFRLRLQANIADDGQPERLDNPEPFFITFSLYDAKEGRKLSEDFHVDPNSREIRAMIPSDTSHGGVSGGSGGGNTPIISNGSTPSSPSHWATGSKAREYIKTAIFSVSKPSADVFLVARIEKVLQGSVSAALEPYMKTTDVRIGTKIHRTMRLFCQRLGHYRMPFAWAARPLFRKYSNDLDTTADFVVYKAESSRMCEDEIIKTLQDMRRADKQMRQQPIQGIMLRVTVVALKSPVQNTLTSSLMPIRSSIDDSLQKFAASVNEVEEFVPSEGQVAHPYATYINHLYVHPHTLKYDGQKAFTKARNIACCIEIRDSDDDSSQSLKIIYGLPGSATFTSSALTTVLHHNSVPDFIDEVKVMLPTHITERHHLLFTFYHISCDPVAKATLKKMPGIEAVVGYAWLPLLTAGRVDVGEHSMRVASALPASYLRTAVNDVKWVDGGKPLFKLNLGLVSSIYTRDPHLHTFFTHCQKLETMTASAAAAEFGAITKLKTSSVTSNGPPGSNGDSESGSNGTKFDKNKEEMLNVVKMRLESLHAVDVSSIINFLPPLLTQLFRLLTRTTNEDVAGNAVRVLIHIVTQLHEVGKTNLLHSYVKYVFVTESSTDLRPQPPQQQQQSQQLPQKTVHEELAQQLRAILRPNMADPLVTGKFLRHSWFFFEIIVKSMAQHLLTTERIKMLRNERFPASFQFHINTLVQSLCQHIVQKHREALTETRSANNSLASFVKKCFTFMDRGFVFRLVNQYMESFSPADSKLLHEYKFEFLRIICSHEHYIPLNLPFMRKQVKSYKDLKHDYTLTEEFQQNHFLVGLLLHEVKATLNEVMDIRKYAITALRNLLTKHSFDSRYSSKAAQARIAALYLPLIMILIENKTRLSPVHEPIGGGDQQQAPPSYQGSLASGSESLSGQSTDSLNRSSTLGSYTSQLSLDQTSLNSGMSGGSLTGASGRPVRGDPNVFSIISGQASAAIALTSLEPQSNSASHHGSASSLTSNSATSVTSVSTEKASDTGSLTGSLKDNSVCSDVRSSVMGGTSVVMRYDKLDQQESKDLLLCFLYVVKNLAEEILLGWLNNCSEYDVLDFFSILEMSMQYFRYGGKKKITSLCIIGNSRKSLTIPQAGRKSVLANSRTNSLYGGSGESRTDGANHVNLSDVDAINQAMLDANLCVEVSMIVLDTVTLYLNTFKEQLQYMNGENHLMNKVFDLYLMFLQSTQSESVHTHAFAALRCFIGKFPTVLFQGPATMCGRLCYEILRCCSSRLDVTRTEACALMYLFMRKNCEFSKGKNFTRVHLQMMISVSQLISNGVIMCSSRFAESLSIISSYASNDKAMQKTSFPVEVKDLTKCIRTVLMSTSKMRDHEKDPEKYIDLQYSLAKSYTSMPELRKTWLDSMATKHLEYGNYSEAAHCYIHIAALVAEYLKRRGEFPQGCTVFKTISPNAESEESGMREDSGMLDAAYTENHLILLLDKCAHSLELAERYELLGEIYRFILPIYERKRDFERISAAYEILHRAYSKVVDVMRTGKRMLGKYFRVAFFGQLYFEDEDGKEYVYKEPKLTGLQEICDRLRKLYSDKFGASNVRLVMDSKTVDCQALDPKLAYIQVTYVTPYFEDRELAERQTDFERTNNIRRFMFETPFTLEGKAHGDIDQQHKRKTILTTSHSFPYVKKRILVVYHKEEILTPIEVAIDEIKNKVAELMEVVYQSDTDLKKLQLKLQGSVSAQVHAGPLAYANAFLAQSKIGGYKREHVETLKEYFRSFVNVCSDALALNARLVSADQMEYHESMKRNFVMMTDRLGEMFGEVLLDDEDRQSIASMGSSSNRGSVVITGATYATQSVNV